MSTRKILVPEDELHNIADAINDRADYVDDLNHIDHDDPQSAHNQMIENSERQMATKDMAHNILQLTVDLSQFYTKEEIDAMFRDKTFKLAFGTRPTVGEEGTFYIINKSYHRSDDDYGIDLSVYIWRNNDFQVIHASTISLSQYALKSDIPSDYQKHLIAGSGISITGDNDHIAVVDYDKLKSLVTGDIGTPFKLILNSITNNVATFELAPNNYSNDPVMSIAGYSPILLSNSDGRISIGIDPDNLTATTLPQSDSSTHVATTEYVRTAIEDIPAGGEGTLKYEILPEGGDVPVRKSDTLYLELGTGRATIGYDEVQPPLRWKLLDDTLYIYIQYNSGLEEIEDTIYSTAITDESGLTPYIEVFGNDMWVGTYTPTWTLTYQGQDVPYVEGTTTLKQICDELHITDYGDESRAVMSATPTLSYSVPFFGYAADPEGCFNNAGIFTKSYRPEDGYDETIKDTLTLHTNIALHDVDYVYRPGYSCIGWSEQYDTTAEESSTNTLYIDGYWTGAIYPVWSETAYDNIHDYIVNFDNYIFDDYTDTGLVNSTEFIFTNYTDQPEVVAKLEYAAIPVWEYDSSSDTYIISPEFVDVFEDESIEFPVTRADMLSRMESKLLDLLSDSSYTIEWTELEYSKIPVPDEHTVKGTYLVLQTKDENDEILDQVSIFITSNIHPHVTYTYDFTSDPEPEA